MLRPCIVFIPDPRGGNHEYHVEGRSSFEAARAAIGVHETHFPRLADRTIVTVVVEGKSMSLWEYEEHNRRQPTYRHRVGRVR
jgi:hypothetical protein